MKKTIKVLLIVILAGLAIYSVLALLGLMPMPMGGMEHHHSDMEHHHSDTEHHHEHDH